MEPTARFAVMGLSQDRGTPTKVVFRWFPSKATKQRGTVKERHTPTGE